MALGRSICLILLIFWIFLLRWVINVSRTLPVSPIRSGLWRFISKKTYQVNLSHRSDYFSVSRDWVSANVLARLAQNPNGTFDAIAIFILDCTCCHVSFVSVSRFLGLGYNGKILKQWIAVLIFFSKILAGQFLDFQFEFFVRMLVFLEVSCGCLGP